MKENGDKKLLGLDSTEGTSKLEDVVGIPEFRKGKSISMLDFFGVLGLGSVELFIVMVDYLF
jgi:hypothetical protein